MKKIGIITGTRAEYGLLEQLIAKISKDPEMELQLYVCGMHLSKEFGETILQITYPITEKIDMKVKKENTNVDMLNSISLGIAGFTKAFEKNKPDLIVVLGDRIEPLAAAIAAHFLHILIAHIHGGDLSFGQFDESTRHAITKFSHLHFAACKSSADRILKMGEEKWRVFDVGSPGVENILKKQPVPKKEIFEKYELDSNKKTFIVVYHPTTTGWKTAGTEFKKVMNVVKKFPAQKIMIYPNSDAGSFEIIKTIEEHSKDKDCIILKSIPSGDFIDLMRYADVMIGNSSSGIIEAPSLGLPVVNIGPRQTGRERAENVLDVECNEDEIESAIKKALEDNKFIKKVRAKESPYGNGTMSENAMKILKTIELNEKLLNKRMTY